MKINVGEKAGEYLVEKYLGTGGFGSVYKVSKEDAGGKYQYALKHITFPSAEMYNEISFSMRQNQADIDAYFNNMLQDIVTEFHTMRDLSAGNSKYFVNYYDHQIFGDSRNYDIFIRMELLIPFHNYCNKVAVTVSDVIKMGIEISEALSICHGKKIIHRDIKEPNIFVNADGDFKLGDFGVARTLDKTTELMSRKGTPFYMAPEVLLNQQSDFNTDIYALAMVLYKLLNKSRYPFVPPYPQAFTNQDIEKAQSIKLTGQKPLRPCLAENILGDIIVKALSSKDERYQTAKEFAADLKKAKESSNPEFLNTVLTEPISDDTQKTVVKQTHGTKGFSKQVTTVGLTGSNSSTVYGGENQNIFNLLNKTETVGTNTSVFNTVEKDQFKNRGMINTKSKINSLKIINFIVPAIFAVVFVFYIDVLARDLLLGNVAFFNSVLFRILILIVSGGFTLIFVIKILVYPDKKTLTLSKESKKWKTETLAFLEKIDNFTAGKTKHDDKNMHYKNLKGELSELKRRVRECKTFWKMTYSARQCEIEVSNRLVSLNSLITQKGYIISVGGNDVKTMSDNKKSEFSLAVNNIKRLIEQREAQLQ